MAKLGFPYSWYGKRRAPSSDFKFYEYVTQRYAVSEKKGVVVPYPSDSPTGDKALKWIYELLGVLDSKASALMRLNGVMLAAAAFLLNPNYYLADWARRLVAVSSLGSTISIACCLLVVSMDWRFLGLVIDKPANADKSRELDFSEEFSHLARIVDFRQQCYRFGWRVSFLTTIAFLIAIIIFFGHLFNWW